MESSPIFVDDNLFLFVFRAHSQRDINVFKKQFHFSLALPSYVLPLNLNFASILGLAMRYVNQMSPVSFLPANQRTEVVAENDDVDVVR